MANNGGTAVAVRPKMEMAAQMFEERREQFALVLPEKVDQDRFFLGLRVAIQKNPKLLECDRGSLLVAALQAAEMGLYVGAAIPHAHLVPFKGKVQLIPDWRGLIYLAVKCGAITRAEPSLVYEGDTFRDVRGSSPQLIHERTYETAGIDHVTHAYLMCWLPNGRPHWRTLTRAHLDVVRERALERNYGKGPWADDSHDAEEMMLKTAVKYGIKTVPIGDDVVAARLRTAIAHEYVERDEVDGAEAANQHAASRTRERLGRLRQQMTSGHEPGPEPDMAPALEQSVQRERAKRQPEPEPTPPDEPPARPAARKRAPSNNAFITEKQVAFIGNLLDSHHFEDDPDADQIAAEIAETGDNRPSKQRASEMIEWLQGELERRNELEREGVAASARADGGEQFDNDDSSLPF